MTKWQQKWRKLIFSIATFTLIICCSTSIRGQSPPVDLSDLPALQTHPLPEYLGTWQTQEQSGEYFGEIEPSSLGYLIWSEFPIKIYVEQPTNKSPTASNQRFQQWTTAIRNSISEWNAYMPLQEVTEQKQADIVVLRSRPKREIKLNPATGLFDIPRAVTAITNYKFYLNNQTNTIAHRMTVEISPSFTGIALAATARHELGHALGIWGHSPDENDALYFSQVSNPPGISDRDINTLKKIYQQPTRLGWKI